MFRAYPVASRSVAGPRQFLQWGIFAASAVFFEFSLNIITVVLWYYELFFVFRLNFPLLSFPICWHRVHYSIISASITLLFCLLFLCRYLGCDCYHLGCSIAIWLSSQIIWLLCLVRGTKDITLTFRFWYGGKWNITKTKTPFFVIICIPFSYHIRNNISEGQCGICIPSGFLDFKHNSQIVYGFGY